MVEQILLKNKVVSLDGYKASGGWSALEKAIRMEPAAIIDEVKKSGLRGRGGAGFPAGLKWSFIPLKDEKAPQGEVKPRYIVCNADEGEPGTFKDRELIRMNPYLLLEGMAIAGRAIGAATGYIYIRGEFVREAALLEKAIGEAKISGFLGNNIFDSGFAFDIIVHKGAGAYICGEETALLESIEGRRGQPRLKPPFPAVEGLFACPTVINNVETLAAVPAIIEKGGTWYASIGSGKSTGTKLFSISGPVKNPGVYEAELGIPFKTVLEEYAGGMAEGKKLKAVIPGGSSTPVLTAEEAMTVKLDYESLAAAGTMLGSGGIIVIAEDTCMVEALLVLAKFYHHESCGQCTPCREGAGWTEKILRRFEEGGAKDGDIELLLDIANKMMGRTICPLADALAMPVISFITKFRDEFDAHAAGNTCRMGHK